MSGVSTPGEPVREIATTPSLRRFLNDRIYIETLMGWRTIDLTVENDNTCPDDIHRRGRVGDADMEGTSR